MVSIFGYLRGCIAYTNTNRSSTIIQNVMDHCHSEPTRAIAYFYFDFNDPRKQNTENLVRSLILQFLAQCQQLPESLQSAYSRSLDGQHQPTIETLTLVLRQMLEGFDCTFILIDALDECTDRESLFAVLNGIMEYKIASLHLLTTSRDLTDIHESLHPLVTCHLPIQNAFVDDDIRALVLETLSNDVKLRKWPPDVQEEIENTLVKGAKGM